MKKKCFKKIKKYLSIELLIGEALLASAEI